MIVEVSVDDFGHSVGMNDSILEAVDNSPVKNVHLIANGSAFEDAVLKLKKRKNVKTFVHLNFLEGVPISPYDQVAHLVDRNGRFNSSFVRLLLKNVFFSKQKKEELKTQIKKEITAQIQKVSEAFDDNFDIHISGHKHIHLLPVVMNSLIELHQVFKIRSIRLTIEPFFLAWDGLKSISCYLNFGGIKSIFLNALSKRARKNLITTGIKVNKYFFGILYSRRMSKKIVLKALSSVKHRLSDKDHIEILFHPGMAKENEKFIWEVRPELWNIYHSNLSRLELRELKKLKDLPQFKTMETLI